jgi:ParB family transcriptional regulator, chromosome partitioning protein
MHSKTVSKSLHTLGLIENIDISHIKPSKTSIREDIGDLNQLTLSIKEKGLLHPIIVRIVNDKFEIVAGNRRLLSCKSMGWKKIPSHVVDLSDEESFEIAMIENVQRKTMNAIEEANAYNRYVKDYGWGGVSDLAKRIGKSQEYISKRLKLLELPKAIQDEIIRRRIKPSMAEELSYVKNENEQSHIAKLIVQRHVTIKKFRESLKMENDGKTGDDYAILYSKENKNHDKIFDNAIVVLKLAMKRMNELLETTEENFIIYEFLLCQQKTINEQIDCVIRARKKHSKLFS